MLLMEIMFRRGASPSSRGQKGGVNKNKKSNFADFSKELGLGSVKNGRSISKRAPGPDYRPDSLILMPKIGISFFEITANTKTKN